MAWPQVDVPFQGSQPLGPRFSAPNPQVRPVRQVLWPLGGEPWGVAPSGVPLLEALLSALPQVAPRIRALLRRARPHRGEWVLPAGPPVVWPQVVPLRQVRLVSPPRELLHPESPRRGWLAGPPAVWPLEASPLVAPPRQVLPRQALVAPPIQESPPPAPQPQGLLASPPQVGQQQEKRQAVEPSPQRP